MKVLGILDFEALQRVMGDLGRSGIGPEGYDPVALLKGLILQSWHSLSDPGLEEVIRVRLDFMLFTDFQEKVPDETTPLPIFPPVPQPSHLAREMGADPG